MQFKCIHTGQVYTFNEPHDIETMQNHPEYTEVAVDDVVTVDEVVAVVAPVVAKKATAKTSTVKY